MHPPSIVVVDPPPPPRSHPLADVIFTRIALWSNVSPRSLLANRCKIFSININRQPFLICCPRPTSRPSLVATTSYLLPHTMSRDAPSARHFLWPPRSCLALSRHMSFRSSGTNILSRRLATPCLGCLDHACCGCCLALCKIDLNFLKEILAWHHSIWWVFLWTFWWKRCQHKAAGQQDARKDMDGAKVSVKIIYVSEFVQCFFALVKDVSQLPHVLTL